MRHYSSFPEGGLKMRTNVTTAVFLCLLPLAAPAQATDGPDPLASGNTAISLQRGTGNSIAITQTGTGNVAVSAQIGDGTVREITQTGNYLSYGNVQTTGRPRGGTYFRSGGTESAPVTLNLDLQ
jgi:hypothetical protein